MTWSIRDHPRVCGEKAKYWMQGREPEGSPPRMRGKVPALAGFIAYNGITPAYAGKSPFRCSVSAVDEDHPRVCGEKLNSLALKCSLRGSPPRMRGKVACRNWLIVAPGITPAYAGKRMLKS